MYFVLLVLKMSRDSAILSWKQGLLKINVTSKMMRKLQLCSRQMGEPFTTHHVISEADAVSALFFCLENNYPPCLLQ